MWLTIAVLLCLAVFINLVNRKEHVRNIPVLPGGLPFLGHALLFVKGGKAWLDECKEKYGDIFLANIAGKPWVFTLSNKYLKEIFGKPQIFDFDAGLRSNAPFHYLMEDAETIEGVKPLHTRRINDTLNMRLPKYAERQWSEAVKYVNTQIGATNGNDLVDFPEDMIRRLVANISARAFVGDEACENEELLQTFMEYADVVEETAKRIRAVPALFRRFFVQDVQRHHNIMKRVLVPVIKSRIQSGETDKEDFLQYLINSYDEDMRTKEKTKEEFIATRTGIMIFASMITTVNAALTTIYDIASRPEIKEKVVAEIKQTLSEYPADVSQRLKALTYVEATIREAIRMQGFTVGVVREVMEDYTFADGKFVAKGTIVAASPHYVHYDPKIYGDKGDVCDFAPERFIDKTYRTTEFVQFGGGSWQCPGRFFALQSIKCLVSALFDRIPHKLTFSLRR